MKRYLVLGALLGGILLSTYAQPPAEAAAPSAPAAALVEGSPEWIVHAFFKRKERLDLSRYAMPDTANRFKKTPLPSTLFADDNYVMTTRDYYTTDDFRAMRVTLTPQRPGEGGEFYLFLRRTPTGWRIDEVRLRTTPPAIRQIAAATQSKTRKPTPEELWEMEALLALTRTDADIQKMFAEKRADLDEMIRLLAQTDYEGTIQGSDTSLKKLPVWPKVHDLKLYYIEAKAQGWVECTLARMGDASVGFLWLSPQAKPPVPSIKGYMVVEHLDGPWYFVRSI